MRRGPTALAFGISLVWCVAAETGFAQKQSAERPSYEVGMRWLLNDGAYDLIRSTSDVYFFAAGPTRKIQLTRDLGLYQVLKDGNVDWQMDPPPPIKWPLEVGKFGTLFNAVMHSREFPSGLPVRFTWEVKAYESVQVPAGVYQAFRIVYLAEYIGDPLRRSGGVPGRQYWNVVMWYAPEARQIVKAEGAGLRGLRRGGGARVRHDQRLGDSRSRGALSASRACSEFLGAPSRGQECPARHRHRYQGPDQTGSARDFPRSPRLAPRPVPSAVGHVRRAPGRPGTALGHPDPAPGHPGTVVEYPGAAVGRSGQRAVARGRRTPGRDLFAQGPGSRGSGEHRAGRARVE